MVLTEGTGLSYGFHGYWARDWTALDLTLEPRRFSTSSKKPHGIRIILDGVINHTGPVTAEDTVWPNWWENGTYLRLQSFEIQLLVLWYLTS
jgi:alpha-amylase